MSVIASVDKVIADALRHRASDIHCEPCEDALTIRFRIDGTLVAYTGCTVEQVLQFISRIKVLANIDVSEKRIPQDGKFSIKTAQGESDLRVATFPTLYGEKVVIRILHKEAHALKTVQLGISSSLYEQIQDCFRRSYGFLLVTGPTGSGKTTTLYALLQELVSTEKSIVTLENPIEYTIRGITQGQVHPEIGFTFARGLRAILRQDPDCIMVGEIRDQETAEIAIQAALTGHMIFSSLHTHDSVGALMRLLDMGIPPFLLNAALTGILAQRLVRTLCTHCRYERILTEKEALFAKHHQLAISRTFDATGCKECFGLGKKGRIGVFEFLPLTPALRSLITVSPSVDQVVLQAHAEGMRPLLYDAFSKVAAGLVSFDELVRIA